MRAKRIRKLPGPLSRDLARLQNEMQSIKRRLDRLIEIACDAELKAAALDNMKQKEKA